MLFDARAGLAVQRIQLAPNGNSDRRINKYSLTIWFRISMLPSKERKCQSGERVRTISCHVHEYFKRGRIVFKAHIQTVLASFQWHQHILPNRACINSSLASCHSD